jgi:hypothetical protein
MTFFSEDWFYVWVNLFDPWMSGLETIFGGGKQLFQF